MCTFLQVYPKIHYINFNCTNISTRMIFYYILFIGEKTIGQSNTVVIQYKTAQILITTKMQFHHFKEGKGKTVTSITKQNRAFKDLLKFLVLKFRFW